MPEYVQIQTYATCTARTFPEVLQQYKEAIERAGCKDQNVLNWLAQIKWPTSDDDGFGDIYAAPFALTPAGVAGVECDGMEVSLYLNAAVPSLEQPPSWVGFNLLFALETVKEHAIATYKAGVGGTLWLIMNELAGAFPEPGVYFTDEWQDNRSWRALTEHVGDPWQFDLAIFPRALANRFEMIPAGFQGTVVEHGFSFAQVNRWEKLPWLEVAIA
ncbi:MAG TPA: hypothetical protein VKR06_19550 [Ktedonosporobacter sp.]|nr:hypothetical protein [Ktedonosporobacter sp.]